MTVNMWYDRTPLTWPGTCGMSGDMQHDHKCMVWTWNTNMWLGHKHDMTMNMSYDRVLRCVASEACGEGGAGLKFTKPEAGWWEIPSVMNSCKQRIWSHPCPGDRIRLLPGAFSRMQPVRLNTGFAFSFLMWTVCSKLCHSSRVWSSGTDSKGNCVWSHIFYVSELSENTRDQPRRGKNWIISIF